MQNFKRSKFENVSAGAMAWIEPPNPSWATTTPLTTPSNCGDWPCTGPLNTVLSFAETDYENSAELAEEGLF